MKKKKNSIHVPRLWRLEHWKLHIARRQWRSNSPRRGRKPYIRKRKTYSHIFSGFGNDVSRGWQRKSTTRRFAADRLLPFTWKTPSVGKNKVNNLPSGEIFEKSVVSHNRNGASRNRSLTKTLLLLSILALVCWLPLIIMDVLIFTFVSETSLSCIYVIANILNYSNSFVNPIVYVFRIPEFQQALRSCCTKRRPAIKMVKTERRNRKVAPITPETQLRILRNDPSHLQVEVEQEGIRKLSFSQLR